MRDGATAARPTVLAVDDEPAVRDALALVLDDCCELLLAPDGPSALTLLSGRRVDVVLLDLLMPHMHGLELLPRLLALDPTMVVVVLSAVVDVESVVRAMKLGAWNYATKPWEPDELVDLVRQAARESTRAPGVLLVGDDPETLAPLHLALQRHVRVATTSAALAHSCCFPANVVIVDSPRGTSQRDGRSVQELFPRASIFLLTDTPYQLDKVVSTVLRLAGIAQASVVLPEQVTNAIAYMASHYRDHVLVGDVARAVTLSEDRLAHVFKEATGFSVKDYLNRLRVTIARRLLTETTAKLDVIADRVGFADTSTFSRIFVDVAGVRPGRFRRSEGSVRTNGQ